MEKFTLRNLFKDAENWVNMDMEELQLCLSEVDKHIEDTEQRIGDLMDKRAAIRGIIDILERIE